jgi:predicted translin family RNA/ssDNA-binding protein
MAPNLAASQHNQIRNIILSKSLTNTQMANTTGYSTRLIKAIHSNLRYFDITKALVNKVRRRQSITPLILEALYKYLRKKPNQFLDELTILL